MVATSGRRQLRFCKPSGELVRCSLHTALLRSPPPPPREPTYKTKEGRIRGSVRTRLDSSLADTSGVRDAKMRWGLLPFRDHVAVPLAVLLRGWPPEFPFDNLSNKGAPGMKALRRLLQLLEASPPQLYFVRATAEELCAAQADAASVCPGPLFPAPAPGPKLGYDSIGRQRRVARVVDGTVVPPRYLRDGPKCAKVVSDALEAEVDAEVDSDPRPRTRGPLPQIHTPQGVRLGWYSTGLRVLSLGLEGELRDDKNY